MPAIRRRGDPLQPVLRPEIPGFFADCLRKAFDELVAAADSSQDARHHQRPPVGPSAGRANIVGVGRVWPSALGPKGKRQ